MLCLKFDKSFNGAPTQACKPAVAVLVIPQRACELSGPKAAGVSFMRGERNSTCWKAVMTVNANMGSEH